MDTAGEGHGNGRLGRKAQEHEKSIVCEEPQNKNNKKDRVIYELEVVDAILPDVMAQGEWCEKFQISDHAPLQISFNFFR
jgi:hypothetical protein